MAFTAENRGRADLADMPISREELINMLRTELSVLTDENTSICKAAADHGIFCHGFDRYGDNELRRRYGWIVRKFPDMTRDQLETIANDWQLAQQQVLDVPFACDVQNRLRDTCCGWNDFSDVQLAEFYRQLTGRDV